jgi:hypothetical protein
VCVCARLCVYERREEYLCILSRRSIYVIISMYIRINALFDIRISEGTKRNQTERQEEM